MNKNIKALKIAKIALLIYGILICLLFGFVFPIAFILGGVFIYLSYLASKKYKKLLSEYENNYTPPQEIIEPVTTPKQKIVIDPEPISQEQCNKMRNMCIDIHNEYVQLLKDYKDADIDDKVYILKECHRKLSVMETTIHKYKCYDELDIYDELEKIEKMAKSFINSYIKDERENGSDDYMIDITQFSFDLDFISDYIYEKDEKLNKI